MSMDQPKEETLVPTADSTNNVFARDASGNKADAAVTTVGVTKSLMAYLKGVLNLLNAIKTSVTFQHKPTIAFSQNSPVADQEYIVLDTTTNVRIVQITASCTNTAPPNYFDVKIVIDGVEEHLYRNNPATVTDYFGAFTADSGTTNTFTFNGTVTNALARAFLTEGRSVRVTMLYHGGTVSQIKCQLSYAQR